ncbi:hypothetical protein HMPREF1568_1616 [Providencia alcalifaciens PAL-3]|nr:hypothetical protein HMPREF1568_1616 [Providencia alcalifaciens PAL-3]EUC99906.1 hypothetical protein HMPREF1566_3749 [Providencia alcalifaciens PAL-1]
MGLLDKDRAYYTAMNAETNTIISWFWVGFIDKFSVDMRV